MLLRSLDVARLSGKGDGFIMDRRSPDLNDHRQPPLAPGDSTLTCMPERRRIVAQVRREVPKNLDFFAVQDSPAGCDDLLTSAVDNANRAGL